MAKSRDRQQRTDAQRIGDAGTGKLDRDAGGDRTVAPGPPATGAEPERVSGIEDAHARVTRLRDEAIGQLRQLGISPETDDAAPREATGNVLDEGDQAQASERQDLAYATRERLAARVNRLTDALRRIEDGTYGRCAACGGPIEPARLAALPEAETCLTCQTRREQGQPGVRPEH